MFNYILHRIKVYTKGHRMQAGLRCACVVDVHICLSYRFPGIDLFNSRVAANVRVFDVWNEEKKKYIYIYKIIWSADRTKFMGPTQIPSECAWSLFVYFRFASCSRFWKIFTTTSQTHTTTHMWHAHTDILITHDVVDKFQTNECMYVIGLCCSAVCMTIFIFTLCCVVGTRIHISLM